MLDNLLEIEIAYGMLKADMDDEEADPLDAHFQKLKCKMEVNHGMGRPILHLRFSRH